MLPGDEGLPLKIKEICLPFVFVRTPGNWSRFYDVRGVQFVRVSRRYARSVWKQARRERNRQRARE
jgi:hypothetical protein